MSPPRGVPWFSRRTSCHLSQAASPRPDWLSAQPASQKVALYANVGADLTHYDVDVAGAELIKRATVTLPAGVQYAWPHASRRYLYVASSSSAPGYGTAGTEHHVTAFRIDPASGALTPHGAPIRLPTRPIHISTDIPSENILVAFNNPSAVRVYRINKDFTPGEEVKQPGPIDAGIFAHQVRVTPDNRLAILVTRGNEGTPTKPEDPGALKVFDYKNGVLTQRSVDRAQRREGVRPAASRFSSDQAVDVRVDRDAEQDVHVSDGRRQDQPGDRIPRGDAGRAEQHQGASGGRHGPRPSERPLSVRGESRRGRRSSFRASRSSKAVKTASWCMRSISPPASRRRSSTSRLARYTRAPFTSTRADACWSPQHNLPVNVRDGDAVKTVPRRPVGVPHRR